METNPTAPLVQRRYNGAMGTGEVARLGSSTCDLSAPAPVPRASRRFLGIAEITRLRGSTCDPAAPRLAPAPERREHHATEWPRPSCRAPIPEGRKSPD